MVLYSFSIISIFKSYSKNDTIEIIKTLQHFLKLTNKFDTIKLLVVTTQKEEYEKQKNLYLKEKLINDVKNNIEKNYIICIILVMKGFAIYQSNFELRYG